MNGEKIDLIVPVTSTSNVNANANTITIANGTVYIAGYYYYQLRKNICYWANGQLVDLPYISNGEISDIIASNGHVYISGSGNSDACFWVVTGKNFVLNSSNTINYSGAYGIFVKNY